MDDLKCGTMAMQRRRFFVTVLVGEAYMYLVEWRPLQLRQSQTNLRRTIVIVPHFKLSILYFTIFNNFAIQ